MSIVISRCSKTLLWLFLTVTSLAFADVQHVLQKGETLYQISKKYNVRLSKILAKNDIENLFAIPAGTTIIIPLENNDGSTHSTENNSYTEYVVKKGDTLFKISMKFNVTINTLSKVNDLQSETLRINQVLFIPNNQADPTSSEKTQIATRENQKSETSTQNAKSSFFSSKDGSIHLDALFRNSKESEFVSGEWPVSGKSYEIRGKIPGIIIEGDENTTVSSLNSGVVIYAALHSSFNNVIIIQGSDGMVYVYGGQKTLLVKQGDTVAKGQKIGALGVMPLIQKAILYFSIWKNDKFIDPRTVLG